MTRKLRREAEVDTLPAKVIKRTAERVRCPPPLPKVPLNPFSVGADGGWVHPRSFRVKQIDFVAALGDDQPDSH
jgi:hypothetical protein